MTEECATHPRKWGPHQTDTRRAAKTSYDAALGLQKVNGGMCLARMRLAILFLSSSLTALSADAQQAATPAPTAVSQPQVAALLQAPLSELRSTVSGLRIAKWKAPGPVKDEAQSNAGSIDRDLGATLPGLIAQADATPKSVANNFAVYRNLDALYEVLLRVSGTAELAAPDEEAANVAHSLLTLDAARHQLADSILSASRTQEIALQQARQPAPPPTPAAQPPTPTAVVSDGPTVTPAHRKPKVKPKVAAPAGSAELDAWRLFANPNLGNLEVGTRFQSLVSIGRKTS